MTDEKPDRVNDQAEKAQELIEKLSERVMVPKMLAPHATLTLFGHEVQGRALPASFSKRLNKSSASMNQTISKVLADIAKLTDTQRGDYRSSEAVGLAEDADRVLTDCVMIVAEFYQIPGVSREKIDDTYTVSQKRQIVEFQLSLNEIDDFLLQPLRISLSVISNVALLGGPAVDSPVLPSSTRSASPGA